jgi:hypothetical protein
VFWSLRIAANDSRGGIADVEDHAVVPTDVLYGGRYLRNLEIAVLLNAMVDAGLAVKVVLKCCYSDGFITRGDE